MDFVNPDVDRWGGRRAAGDFVHTRESLLGKLAWNLDRCVAEMLSRHTSGENVAYALIDYASASVALQRRVRADYIKRRRSSAGFYPPYIHLSGADGATSRQQIYNRIAFQAALADLAEQNTRGFVRETRWDGGEVRIRLEAIAEHRDLVELLPGMADLQASRVDELTSEGKAWWMPVFQRDAQNRCEWRGVSALRLNFKDWEQLLLDLSPFLDLPNR